jgi:hypothetical protein
MSGRGAIPRPPRAPWGAFPLSELTVLVAVGSALYGVVAWGRPNAMWAFGAAACLGSLAGLEVAIREHFAARRSHTTVLAASAAVPVLTGAMIATGSLALASLTALAVYLAASAVLWRAFARRHALTPPAAPPPAVPAARRSTRGTQRPASR